MIKNIIIKKSVIGCAVIGCIALTGCSQFDSQIPNLTNEEEALVVEYATETLLKYDSHAGDKIGRKPEDFVINKSVIEGTVEDLDPVPEPTPEPSLDITIPDENIENPSDVLDNTEDENSVSSVSDVIEFPSGVSITYSGYEVTDHYPDSVGDYFVLTASPGKELLLVKFNVVNNGSDTALLDVASTGVKFKIILNDGMARNALTTMLLNDLAFYKDNIEPGESKELVVVGEYVSSELQGISSVGLRIKTKDNMYDIKF